ncbi:hypothetical protein [Rhodoplanes elegans]|uniref:hypothetical protein n=1 Tax=Rhodoplanes elegans TaxID=29408 RepID=UPI0019115A6C|nr:hypothetical protein [Rhodoplanes elegans]
MDLSQIKTNSALIEQGEWIGDLPELGDVAFRVRGLGNADYRALQHKLINEIPARLRRKGLGADDQDRIQTECLIETVLTDWRGLTSGGAPLPYSREKARELLTDPDFRRLRDAVFAAASMVGEDVAAADEALEKNSETSSAGA